MTVALIEHDIFAPGARDVVFVDENMHERIIGRVTARTFQGKVVGEPASTVIFTLDPQKDALRGTVYSENRAYSLATSHVAGETLLETTWTETQSTAARLASHDTGPSLEATTPMTTTTPTTTIRPVGDATYASHPSWTTHLTDVFNQQHAM